MPKAIKAILSALILGVVTAAGYRIGKAVSILFERSTIRIWFIPLGNGTGGIIMWGLITLIGFACACMAASSFYNKH